MAAGVKITDDDFRRACDVLRDGLSMDAAAKAIGATVGGLIVRLRIAGGRQALGIPPAAAWDNVDTRGPRVMANLILAGASATTLCEQWGISETTVNSRVRWMRQHGFIPRDFIAFHSQRLSDERHDAAITAAFEDGKCPDEIGHQLVIPGTFVRKRLLVLGLLTAPSKPKRIDPPGVERERRPRGWLMTEAQVAALFARARASSRAFAA